MSVQYYVHLLTCAVYLPLQCGCEFYGAACAYTYTHPRPQQRLAFVLLCRSQAAGDPGKYQNTDWASAFTSQLQEYDYWVTDVEGVVPDTLRGTLFRNGPGRFENLTNHSHVLNFHPCFPWS